ncbi:hypothetical protein Q8F55_001417 [Vanrija albida]|uniref:Uncharacterized protein n=1 Tax=Vanrija albida TaxID=181172 RepID=A0ABR3QG09_9TREE
MPSLRICLSPGPFSTPTWSPTHRDSLKPVHQHWFTTPLHPGSQSRASSVPSTPGASPAISPMPLPSPPVDRWSSTPDWTSLTRAVSSPL